MNLKQFAKKFIDVGVNVLPTKVNEKYPKVNEWKQYQTRLITEAEIEKLFTKAIDGIGIVSGQISSNLEVIDFDNKRGDIEEVFNEWKDDADVCEIAQRCIIERTQNGGFHVFYRCEQIDGNKTLAKVKINGGGYETIIETRGEGGFCVVYPSKNYEKIWGTWERIPTIEAEEREILLQHCKAFNEIEPEERHPRNASAGSRPGDLYSSSPEGIAEAKDLLTSAGWVLVRRKNNGVEHWRRPGAKTKGIDATFRDAVFYVFSSNAKPFAQERGYTAFSILIELRHNGNLEAAVKELRGKGYKSERTNSNENESFYYSAKMKGTGKDALKISKERFLQFLFEHGFGKIYIGRDLLFIRIHEGHILENVTIPQIKDYVLKYIAALTEPILESFTRNDLKDTLLSCAKDLFSQSQIEFLEVLEMKTLRDSKDEAYFFYKNCWVRANISGIQSLPYSKLQGYIWKSQIIDRDFKEDEDGEMCEFERFITNICKDRDAQKDALETAIGYLMHTYKDPAQAKAIIFCDEGDTDQGMEDSNGRSGKSLVGKAIGKLRNECRIDARNFKADKNFAFQSVNYDTQFIHFNDVSKRFDFERLFSIITDAINIEKKNRDEFIIAFEESPKILLSTNYVISVDGSSGEDRKFEIEFSNHYNIEHKPLDEFGHRFFDDWDSTEWHRFDNYMIGRVCKYLRDGLQKYESLILKRRLLITKTRQRFVDWAEDYFLDETGKKLSETYLADLHNEGERGFLSTEVLQKKYFDSEKITETNKFDYVNTKTFGKWLSNFAKSKKLIKEEDPMKKIRASRFLEPEKVGEKLF